MDWTKVVILLCVWLKNADANFVYTRSTATRCKEHISQHGYSYDTFYQIQSDMRASSDPNKMFEMHLAIQATSNGHILLSPVKRPSATDPVYEIVVGGGGNTFTELRRQLRRNAKVSSKTHGVLSNMELRGFYITISKDGLISFGREGEILPIISFYDVDPLDIKYLSFASWAGVEAKFLYDCPLPGGETNDSDVTIATNSKEVARNLTPSEQIKKTLLLGRAANLEPETKVDIQMGVVVTNARYDAFESKLIAGLSFVTSWTDKSMTWDPNKTEAANITKLYFRSNQIWRPTFLVFNSDDVNPLDAKNPGFISMNNKGEATFHFKSTVESWCVMYTASFNKWPHDEYVCVIVIQPWDSHEQITMGLLEPIDLKMQIFSDIDAIVRNEWEVSWNQKIVPAFQWNKMYPNSNNDTNQSDRFLITLSLKRKATSYNIVFYTPLLVLVTFVLLSFWSEPLNMSRIWFYIGCIIVVCMGLCYVDYLIPCHTVPSILVLYITVLVGVLIALLLQVALMTKLAKSICDTRPIHTTLSSAYFRFIFCLPTMTMCRNYSVMNDAYSHDDADAAIVTPRNGNLEEMQSENPNVTHVSTFCQPAELAEALDKLLFFVYITVFTVMLTLHF
ncbi:neuronal acetylcholine receptor subunit beta-2-like [Achroia grisella]|uniref:neuronal acetylcholine receptor subunit beta-2-like n=1 Tax=Achroia grisella TaxID=688607 RepID=UPI0027D20217|nr:neuronal acetylcholine receptor subunit beta-2-like [Achroia grisella]